MAAVFGLGNPGEDYALTRHNVGFRVLDELRSRWGARPGERSAEYREWVAEYCGKAVALVDFLSWCLSTGQDKLPAINYAPLGKELRDKSVGQLKKVTVSGQPLVSS